MATDLENLERGNALLLPLDLSTGNVQSLEFRLERFRNAAAAKSWAVKHGMVPTEVRQLRDVISARVRDPGEFDPTTVRRERVAKDVWAVVGIPLEGLPPVRKAVPDADASVEEKREAQRARAERWGIEALEGKGENLSFPADGPEREEDYADPVNLKYPVHTEENAANARVRFKQNADAYEREKSKAIVHERIVRAELKFGIDPSFDPDDPLDALLPEDLRDELSKVLRVSKRGDLFVRKGDSPDPEREVRFFGIVMKPGVPDAEGDATTAEVIERANEEFMREFQRTGLMHKKDVSDRVRIVQNVIAPIDLDFPLEDGGVKRISKGTWYQQLFSNDADVVRRVRAGQLNGLSIGGRAKRVSAEEVGPEGPTADLRLSKRDPGEVRKGDGDPVKNWFVDLHVEEVSVVDAGANEEELFLVKRREPMSKQDEKRAPEPTPVPAPVTPEVPVGKVAEVAAAVTSPTPAPEVPAVSPAPVTPPVPAPEVPVGKAADLTAVEKAVTAAVEAAVSKGMQPLTDRISQLEKLVGEQGEALRRAEVVRAAAKGESVPDGTAQTTPSKPVSKWAGSAIGNTFGSKRA